MMFNRVSLFYRIRTFHFIPFTNSSKYLVLLQFWLDIVCFMLIFFYQKPIYFLSLFCSIDLNSLKLSTPSPSLSNLLKTASTWSLFNFLEILPNSSLVIYLDFIWYLSYLFVSLRIHGRHYTWMENSWSFFSKSKPVRNSKNCSTVKPQILPFLGSKI